MMSMHHSPSPLSSLHPDTELLSPLRICSSIHLSQTSDQVIRNSNVHHRSHRHHQRRRSGSFLTTTWITTFMITTMATILMLLPTRMVDAALSCESNEDCETMLRPGSVCLETTKTCSNPFQRGCLATLLPNDERFAMGRICNSDDDYNKNGVDDDIDEEFRQLLCYQPDFIYDEIRVHNGTCSKRRNQIVVCFD